LDQIGFFTQDLAGIELAASVLCRQWKSFPVPSTLPVLGVPTGPYLQQAEPEALEAFEQHLAKLKAVGCKIIEVPALNRVAELNTLHRRLVFAEFAREHAEIYAKHAPLYRKRTAEIIEIGKKVSGQELTNAKTNISALRQELESAMARAGVDLWVTPSALGPAPEGIHATGDPNMNLPWTHAGMPAITLPAGKAKNGLPLGLQFVAPFDADEKLVAWCRALEGRL
jgi:Asp-tRNA(Asn)/Glu-tRNA(Gln) amidotransferase A subunit family amidase